jgi:hypothetical protein
MRSPGTYVQQNHVPSWVSKSDPRKAKQQLRQWREKRLRSDTGALEWWLLEDAAPDYCSDEEIARNGKLVERMMAGVSPWDTNAQYRRLAEFWEARWAAERGLNPTCRWSWPCLGPSLDRPLRLTSLRV